MRSSVSRVITEAASIPTSKNSYSLRTTGETVIIDGFCLSVCTIVPASVPHDQICVTPRATLGFHPAYEHLDGILHRGRRHQGYSLVLLRAEGNGDHGLNSVAAQSDPLQALAVRFSRDFSCIWIVNVEIAFRSGVQPSEWNRH